MKMEMLRIMKLDGLGYNNVYNGDASFYGMQNFEGVSRSKDRILSTLRLKGPCLPVQISKEIDFSPLFASAFLSELKAEGKIKISNMKVGSSPLYFLEGQEKMLEKFSGYLNQREREAFSLLKEKLVLEDSEQSPVMRVALRAIKDFAHPIKLRVNGESKHFWKYFNLSDEEVAEAVKNGTKSSKTLTMQQSIPNQLLNKDNVQKKIELKKEDINKNLIEEERPLAEKKKIKVKDNEFVINVKDYLRAKDIEILEVLSERKRDFEARIRIDTMLGKQEFYLMAKDKKTVSDNDFAVALQKAQSKKMLAAVMATGSLNKKGKEHLEQWGNLVKYEKLKF